MEGLSHDDAERYGKRDNRRRNKEEKKNRRRSLFFFVVADSRIFCLSRCSPSLSFFATLYNSQQADVLRAGEEARRARILEEQEGHAGEDFFFFFLLGIVFPI